VIDRDQKRTSESSQDGTLAGFAAGALSELRESLLSFESPAMSGDVDAVHDMRVTSRRMRVALNNFASCLPREYRKELRTELSNLADALGKVRDLDVMNQEIGRILLDQPLSRKKTIEKLRARVRARRRFHFKRLTEYLTSEEYRTLKAHLRLIPEKINEAVQEAHGKGSQGQKNSAA